MYISVYIYFISIVKVRLHRVSLDFVYMLYITLREIQNYPKSQFDLVFKKLMRDKYIRQFWLNYSNKYILDLFS